MGSLVVFGVIMSAIAYRDTMSAGMVGLAITQALDVSCVHTFLLWTF